jgi:hypothetical protein
MSNMNEIQHPEQQRKNDRRRRTSLSEINSINERRSVNDPNAGPASERYETKSH